MKKKQILTIVLLGIYCCLIQAQLISNIDFEKDDVSFISVGDASMAYSLSENPNKKRLNTSNRVLKIEVKGVTNNNFVTLSCSPVRTTSSNRYLHVMVYTPHTQFSVGIGTKVFGNEAKNVVFQNQWVEMVYLLSPSLNVSAIRLYPCSEGAFYVDNIRIDNNPEAVFAKLNDADVVAGEKQVVHMIDEKGERLASMNVQYELEGNSELHYISETTPMVHSTVFLNSEDAWLFFDNMRPSEVRNEGLLKKIFIKGEKMVIGTNARLELYGEGSVVIPHGKSYTPLTVYTEADLQGSSTSYAPETYYKSLGTFNNKIASFVLKRGYMVTFADLATGGGFSRVYIATDEDLVVNKMPIELDETVSFVRVFPWRYTTKKGYCDSGNPLASSAKLNCTWFYSWSADKATSSDLDYAPMRHGRWWPGWESINDYTGVNHVLAFNEPDKDDQANMTIQDMLSLWPNLMASGLRVSSPSYSSIGNGLSNFLRECEHRNYRVDFVALHAYFGSWEKSNWLNYFSSTYKNVCRPLWITEWNNGANWTGESGNSAEQVKDLTYILAAMEETNYVERYSIYNWVEDWRRVLWNDLSLTDAGMVYRDKESKVSFNRTYEYVQNPVIEKNQRFLIRNKRDGYLYQEGANIKTSGNTNMTNMTANYYWTVEYVPNSTATGHYRLKNLATGDYMVYLSKNAYAGFVMQNKTTGNTKFSLANYTTEAANTNQPIPYYTISWYNTTLSNGTYNYDYQALDSYGSTDNYMVGSYSDYKSDNQLWTFVPQDSFVVADTCLYCLFSKLNRKLLTSTTDSLVVKRKNMQDLGQYWYLQSLPNSTYLIVNKKNGMSLALTAEGLTYKEPNKEDTEQQFSLAYVARKEGTSYYTIRKDNQGIMVKEDGISMATPSIKDAQLWYITSFDADSVITDVTQQVVNDGDLFNYPNPVIEKTTISYYLPLRAEKVKLSIFNESGVKVEEMNLGAKEGTNQLEWNRGALNVGIYFYEIAAERKGKLFYKATKRMMLQ